MDVPTERRPKFIVIAKLCHALGDGGSFACFDRCLSDDFDTSCFMGADKSASLLQIIGINVMALLAFPRAVFNQLTKPHDKNRLTERKISNGGLTKGPMNANSAASVDIAKIKQLSKANDVTINDVLTGCFQKALHD